MCDLSASDETGDFSARNNRISWNSAIHSLCTYLSQVKVERTTGLNLQPNSNTRDER